jgi:hypothetical protein
LKFFGRGEYLALGLWLKVGGLMLKPAVTLVVLSVLCSTLLFAECAKLSSPGAYITMCSCTGQRVYTTSCQYDEFGTGCEDVIPGNYCGSNGHLTCYIGYAQSVDCSQVRQAQSHDVAEDPIGRSWAPRVVPASCDRGSRTLTDWLETTPRFSDNQTRPSYPTRDAR